MVLREDQSPVSVRRIDWASNHWLGRVGVGVGGVIGDGVYGGYSHESEHDLAALVSDFLESGCGDSNEYCSSDSDHGFSDLALLADKISLHKHSEDQKESDLLSIVCSLILSINWTNYLPVKSDACNARCLRYSLVKLLQSSGYDAAICTTKWQGSGRLPGGEHEFIDIITYHYGGLSERFIVDIDFRSHFEIARAVRSYNAVLNSLPVVYVGRMPRLRLFLQTMEQAARSSLKQNSMPLPPWRSLAYLEAKWESVCQRTVSLGEETGDSTCTSSHKHCNALLWRLKSCIRSEIRAKGFVLSKKRHEEKRPKAKNLSNFAFCYP